MACNGAQEVARREEHGDDAQADQADAARQKHGGLRKIERKILKENTI